MRVAEADSPTRVTTQARCCAVVVHYRDAATTLRCVQSLRSHAPGTPVILVDNASPDGSGAELARVLAEAREVTLLREEANAGFGAGCNRGIEQALLRLPQLEHVLLLNPDAEITPGCLESLEDTARRHADAGIVGARVVAENGRDVWFENGRVPRWTLSRFHVPAPSGEREFRAEFVTGACMLVATALLRQGLRFDEGFFLYGEDADLCLRAAARGRTLWVNTEAVVRHEGGGSHEGDPVLDGMTAAQVYWHARAKVLLARKHLGLLQRVVFYAVAFLVKPAAGVLTGRGVRFLRPYLDGLRAGFGALDRAGEHRGTRAPDEGNSARHP